MSLNDGVKQLVDEEYKRASEKYGTTFNSPHEAYAVILEEIDETHENIQAVSYWHDLLWNAIKKISQGK